MTGAEAGESRGAPQGQTQLRGSQPGRPAPGPQLAVPLTNQNLPPAALTLQPQSFLHKRILKITFYTRVDIKMNMFLLYVETFSSF